MKCEGELINMTRAWDNVFHPTELLKTTGGAVTQLTTFYTSNTGVIW